MPKLCGTHKLPNTATLAVWGPKGGTGKTTTAVTLARLWRKQKPVVVDLDEQQAVSYFATVLRPGTITDRIPQEHKTPAIIDCPDVFEVAKPALQQASLIIVPVQCEMLAFAAFVQWYDRLRESGYTLPVKVLLTMYQASGVFKDAARRVRDDLYEEFPGVAFETIIPQAPIIKVASNQGRTVLDFAPEHRVARLYQQLGKEIEVWHEPSQPPHATRAASPKAKA